MGDAAGSVLGMAKSLIWDGTKCRWAPQLRGEWPLRGQALECQALQLQTCCLITLKALDTELLNSHKHMGVGNSPHPVSGDPEERQQLPSEAFWRGARVPSHLSAKAM